MTESDFRTILEAFPGKEQIKIRTAILYYVDELSKQFDFLDLVNKIKSENLKVSLPKEEEVWIKFIALKNLVNAVLEFKKASFMLHEKDILSEDSLKLSEEIAKKFKEFYPNACIQQASDVSFYGLCQYVIQGNKFLD